MAGQKTVLMVGSDEDHMIPHRPLLLEDDALTAERLTRMDLPTRRLIEMVEALEEQNGRFKVHLSDYETLWQKSERERRGLQNKLDTAQQELVNHDQMFPKRIAIMMAELIEGSYSSWMAFFKERPGAPALDGTLSLGASPEEINMSARAMVRTIESTLIRYCEEEKVDAGMVVSYIRREAAIALKVMCAACAYRPRPGPVEDLRAFGDSKKPWHAQRYLNEEYGNMVEVFGEENVNS